MACQRAHKRIVESFPLRPGLSGAYSNLSVRSLAFWLFIQEISSSESLDEALLEARGLKPLLYN